MDTPENGNGLERKPVVPLRALLISFLKLGTTSFGGGTVAWTHREIVERRQWLTEEKFLRTLAIAQVLPGANPVNLAVYIGMQLRGFAGALLATFGMVALPFCIILLLGLIYHQISAYPQTQSILGGLACVGIASMLITGIKSSRRLKGRITPICIAALVFVLVGVLRWPMIAVVVPAIPLSILVAYWFEKDRHHG